MERVAPVNWNPFIYPGKWCLRESQRLILEVTETIKWHTDHGVKTDALMKTYFGEILKMKLSMSKLLYEMSRAFGYKPSRF